MVPILNSLGALAAGYWSFVIVKKSFGISFKRQKRGTLLYYLKDANHIFTGNVAISLYTTSTTFILGLFTNNTIVGYYATIEKVVGALQGMLLPVYQSLYPFLSNLQEKSQDAAIRVLEKILTITIPSLILIILGIWSSSHFILGLLFGERFVVLTLALNIMVLKFLFVGIAHIYANLFLLTFGYVKSWRRLIFSASLFGISLIFLFVGWLKFELMGAVASVVITEFIVLVLSFVLYKKKIKEIYYGNRSI